MIAIPSFPCKTQQLLAVAPLPPAALPNCAHARLTIGLDQAYCPDCRRDFKPRTPEYKRAIALPPSEIDCAETVCTIAITPAATKNGSERPPEHPSSRPPEKSKRHTPASGWVEKYPAKGGRYHYYRYCWQSRHKGKIEKLHIPSDSGKLAAVMEAISAGRCPQEISQMLKKCSGGRIKSPLGDRRCF